MPGGGGGRDALVARLRRRGSTRAAGPGPTDDPGYRPRSRTGWSAATRPSSASRMRAWLVELLGAEGVAITLEEPADWSRLGPRPAPLEP